MKPNAYEKAVEQDRLAIQEMLKTMTPEQINKFCFENGFEVPKSTDVPYTCIDELQQF